MKKLKLDDNRAKIFIAILHKNIEKIASKISP